MKDAVERRNLTEQAGDIVKENAMSIAKIHVYPEKEFEASDVELIENDEEERWEGVENINKKTKYDPLAEFRNASCVSGPKKSSNLMAEVNEELRRYSSISSVNLKQTGNVRSIFDPLLWWGEQRYSFSILSCLANQLLVIPASSAESERHFSGAGRIVRKDRNRLKDDAVESSVVRIL